MDASVICTSTWKVFWKGIMNYYLTITVFDKKGEIPICLVSYPLLKIFIFEIL